MRHEGGGPEGKSSEGKNSEGKNSEVRALAAPIWALVIVVLLGVPGAVLWGVMTTILSFLPLVGGALVWAPISIWLAGTLDDLRPGSCRQPARSCSGWAEES